MVGAERDDVVAGADGAIELIEQFTDRYIQAREDVLDLVAAWAICVPDQVERRETHTKEVDLGPFAEIQRLDSHRGHLAQVCIRARRPHPVSVEFLVWLSRF